MLMTDYTIKATAATLLYNSLNSGAAVVSSDSEFVILGLLVPVLYCILRRLNSQHRFLYLHMSNLFLRPWLYLLSGPVQAVCCFMIPYFFLY